MTNQLLIIKCSI